MASAAGQTTSEENNGMRGGVSNAFQQVSTFQQGSTGDQDRLRVLVGKSLLLSSPEALKRVSVTDSAIASAVIVSPRQVVIHGLTLGTVTLLLWDEQERAQSYELRVERDLTELRESLRGAFPGENINPSSSRELRF